MSHLLKNLIIALGITILLGVLYFVFVKEGTPEDGPVVRQEKTEVLRETERVLSDIRELDTYELDESLFKGSAFRSLRDFRVTLPTVDTKRENPFEPVR